MELQILDDYNNNLVNLMRYLFLFFDYFIGIVAMAQTRDTLFADSGAFPYSYENNVFKTFDYPILYAKRTQSSGFKENTQYEGDVLGQNIKTKYMKNGFLKKEK